MARMAKERGADGVICGHIHHAEIREIDGINYLNDGDWVENCTALVEHFDGHWEILALGGHARLRARRTVWDPNPPIPTTSSNSGLGTPRCNQAKDPLEATNKAKECAFSSSPTLGTHKSTASSEP